MVEANQQNCLTISISFLAEETEKEAGRWDFIPLGKFVP